LDVCLWVYYFVLPFVLLRQKWRVIFILGPVMSFCAGYLFLSQNGQMRVCWLHSGRKKHFLSWAVTFQGHRNSESTSDIIAEYLFQHGKSYTRQDLQYTAQERKDSETRKILATLQMSKVGFTW
jgi:hypothetical protein